MEDLSDLFPGVQRHGPITLSPVLEFGFGSGSYTEDPPTLPSLDFFQRTCAPSVSPDHEPGFVNLALGLGFRGQEDQDWVRHQEQVHEEALGLGLGFRGQEAQDWVRHQDQEHEEALGLGLGFRGQEDQDLVRHRQQEQEHEEALGLGLGFRCQEDQDWVRHRQQEQEHEEALGIGLGFAVQEDQDSARHLQQEQEREEAFEDWAGDEFFIGLRSTGRGNEFSRARILGFESNSEPDTNQQIVTVGSDPDPGLPLCLNCLRIHDPSPASAEEFEWEEIDGSTDVISTVIQEDDFQEGISFEMGGIAEEEVTDVARTDIEWEVLHHLDTDTDTYYMDNGFEDDFVGYDDLLFGQFQELKGGRPAAKSVVESLPTVVLKKEEVNCAVCKDEILAEEKAKKLPCCHYYHEECILRWLGMRSTCPLCRYELPTDDAEYEKRKARRAGSNSGEGQV